MPSNKSFGILFSFIFAAILTYGILKEFSLFFLFIIFFIFIFFLIMTIFFSHKLIFLNFLWMKFGFLLGSIISPIILIMLFYVVITPIKYLSKFFGKEFIIFLLKNKKFWLLPIAIIILIFGALLVLSQGSAVAPFIYTIF